MIFRRTGPGLSNQHLFLNVDAVVFVEGGKSPSKEKVSKGKFASASIDIQFWQNMFKFYCSDKRLQFRAIGSKPTLQSIVDDIEAGVIENVYVAMDRDHDGLYGRIKKVEGVIYTYGYSWENDVWNPDIIEDVFSALCFVCDVTANVKAEIEQLICEFESNIRCAVFGDVMLGATENSLLPRRKSESLIDLDRNKRPSVNKKTLTSCFNNCDIKTDKMVAFGEKKKIVVIRDCYGHLLASFCYRIVMFLIKKWSNLPVIAKDYVYLVSIDKFFLRFYNGEYEKLRKHYGAYFASLT